MSELPKKTESALDRLVREAKQDLEPHVPDARWAAMERTLVARMAAERSALVDEVNVTSITARRRARVFQLGAAALAAAAAIAMFVRHEPSGALVDGWPRGSETQAELTAGSLRATEGTGEVRVGGLVATAGHVLRAGDVVEVDGARAILERPRKVMWLLERGPSDSGGRARVKSAAESLVVGLEDGAIEAQVTPVASGEAFAVDVATDKTLVRVAVHGTHLRVARSGSRVVIDLTEGVVSIGFPPRSGSTYGTLVTAPSHVEFDAANLEGTLRIDHSPEAVRAAVPFVSHDAPVTARNDVPVVPAHGPAAAPATVPRPTAPVRAPDPSHPETIAKPDPTRPALSPRDAIALAVRDCAAARHRPDNVRVTVTSSLKLRIAAGGDIETAQFDPPLLPEIQSCATAAIYKAKIEGSAGGTVTIPIDFTY